MLLAHFARLVGLAKQKLYESTQKRSPHWAAVEHEHLKTEPLCAACGTDKHAQVHHKLPFHTDPSLELDPTNLITLCMSVKQCHLLIGHGGNFKFYNPFVVGDCQQVKKYPDRFTTYAGAARGSRKPNVPVVKEM